MVPESICYPLSFEDELNCVIEEGQSPIQPVRYETLLSKVQKEMTLFENGGIRNNYLERAMFIYNDSKTNKCRV